MESTDGTLETKAKDNHMVWDYVRGDVYIKETIEAEGDEIILEIPFLWVEDDCIILLYYFNQR